MVFCCQFLVRTRKPSCKVLHWPPEISDRRFLQDRDPTSKAHAKQRAIRELKKKAWCCSKRLPEHEQFFSGTRFRKPKFLSMSDKFVFVCLKHFLNMYECNLTKRICPSQIQPLPPMRRLRRSRTFHMTGGGSNPCRHLYEINSFSTGKPKNSDNCLTKSIKNIPPDESDRSFFLGKRNSTNTSMGKTMKPEGCFPRSFKKSSSENVDWFFKKQRKENSPNASLGSQRIPRTSRKIYQAKVLVAVLGS